MFYGLTIIQSLSDELQVFAIGLFTFTCALETLYSRYGAMINPAN